MSQFRTSADLKLEVLAKAGEPTNGNSSYDSEAMLYLNKAHQVLIGGGNIFSLEVDEAWTWARSRYPIVLELQPAITTGSITVTQNSRTITFSVAPTASVEGWFFKTEDDRTVYKITQHTASSTTATIDAGYMKSSGSKNYRTFKLDYEIFPKYLTVDSRNDKIDFVKTGSAQITATLTHGSYTPTEYIAHVASVITAAAAGPTITGSYDAVLKLFTLTSNLSGGTVFKLLGATGTNRRRSALPTLGLDLLDYTGAASYSSTYIIGGISRLVEPFRIYVRCRDPFIYSADPARMELDYPISHIREFTPMRFARMLHDNEGSITVRFNSYPKEAMKVEINWVPIPIDLQNNDASYPIIPRADIDILIHAAATFILFDKNDDKWKDMLAAVDKQLQAMQKKNRSELFRSGENFGQIVPREDRQYLYRRFRPRYGYTADS